MAFSHVDSIKVSCWGHTVGYLAADPAIGAYAFSFDESFRKTGIDLSPLALPLTSRGIVAFPNLPKQAFMGLPAFIVDCLPDTFGNNLINRWMAEQGIPANSITPLDRLAYMGKRAMGALEFEPALRSDDSTPFVLEMQSLVEAARLSITSLPVDDKQLSELISVGTSAGGMRAKAVVGYDASSGSFISGQFDLPQEYEHWLIKFDIESIDNLGQSHDYGRVEYAYSLMAAQAGITMAPCILYETGGRAHFMTKRFDRIGNTKVHMQTLFAMAELDYQPAMHSYNQLFMTIDALGIGYNAIDEMFNRMVFNVAAFNNDDHVKNHSFILTQDSSWQLAPAYDVTYAYNSQSAWTSQHSLSVNGKFKDITRSDLLTVAERFHVANPIKRIDSILAVIDTWPDYARQAGVSSQRTEDLQRAFKATTSLLA